MKKLDYTSVIDSRDVIERLEELKELMEAGHVEPEEREEYYFLCKLEEECENFSDWEHGQSIIHEDYFTEYIAGIIKDCYPMPAEFDKWPWNCIDLDKFYEDASEKAKIDYHEFDTEFGTFYVWAY